MGVPLSPTLTPRRAVAVLIIGLLGFVAWRLLVSGAPVRVSTEDRGVLIDTRFLGEYYLGAFRIEVTKADGSPVWRVASPSGACRSFLFRFVAGRNDLPAVGDPGCSVVVPEGRDSFDLQGGERYRFSLLTRNRLGFLRRSDCEFEVPQ